MTTLGQETVPQSPAPAPHRFRTLFLTGVLHAFTHLYGVALLPLYLEMRDDLHLPGVERATLLVTLMGLAYFLPSYPLGILADKFNHKKLLVIGLIVNAVGYVALSAAPGYAWAVVAVIIAGFGGSFFHPAATSLILRLFPEARGRALGLLGIGASVGFFLGPLYTGWRVTANANWRMPVLELGLLGLVAAAVFWWFAADQSPPQPIPAGAAGPENLLRRPDMFPTRTAWIIFIAMSLCFSMRDFAGSSMGTTASLFLQNAHQFTPGFTGLALSGIFLMSAVSNPLFGHLSDRGRIRWIFFVLVAAAALITFFPRVPPAWVLPVLLAYGFFFMASYPMTEAGLLDAVPDGARGRVFGLFITLAGVLANASHWISGKWVESLGSATADAAQYYPWFGRLSLMVIGSLLALPLLHALGKQVRFGSNQKAAS